MGTSRGLLVGLCAQSTQKPASSTVLESATRDAARAATEVGKAKPQTINLET
jgi:hypothetical protein